MIDEERVRRERLAALRAQDINPYPATANRTHTVTDFLQTFDAMGVGEATLVGRIRSIRKHGGLTFVHIQDASGKLQLVFHKDKVGDNAYEFFHAHFDVGDHLQATGHAFTTKKGEKSLDVSSFVLLAKALLPLPEKWHGLQDVETRFRKRYLDLLMNEDVTARMHLRSKILTAMRSFLDAHGWIEVETPTLQPVYGGGFARPFVTHHHALDADFYLRISDEMYLKRLLVGGFEGVYEITKVFRNEGIDRDHNPEFTMMEAQIAYQDYRFGMDIFEELFEAVALSALSTTQVKHEEGTIELKRPWKRYRLIEAVEQVAGLEASTWTEVKKAKNILKPLLSAKAQKILQTLTSPGACLALAFEELVEEKLIQPTIVYDYPIEVSPLAKKCEQDARYTQRFEVFALGSEIGNNYSELNDPEDLMERFIEEKKKAAAGFDEAHQTDMDYLEAIKHGMPPACGLGVGIDRMVMLLTGAKNIKEVILFPTLRPRE